MFYWKYELTKTADILIRELFDVKRTKSSSLQPIQRAIRMWWMPRRGGIFSRRQTQVVWLPPRPASARQPILGFRWNP